MKSLNEVRELVAKGYNVIPLVRELPADTLTPVAAFLRLADPKAPSFLLESVEGGERLARYSFLGTQPFETWRVEEGRVLRTTADGREEQVPGHPFYALGSALRRFHCAPEPGLPPFCGGAVGSVSYEMVRHLEPSVRLAPPEGPEAELMLFKNVAAFDHVRHRVLLISNVLHDGKRSLSRSYASALEALHGMEDRLSWPLPKTYGPELSNGKPHPAPSRSLGRPAFLKGVEALKSRIRAGDIFQGVLSEQLELSLRSDPFSIYRALRRVNPSPYMFFIGSPDIAALGASPEMLVKVSGRTVETRPIAGTRPRGRSEEEDLRMERQLLASVKERAEHVMLVDLGRNDIGRVAEPGSVSVPSFMEVERYSHVMHLVSSVRGRLRRGVTAWEAFGACFPAGTVTGAPKIRAMQLLSELEPVRRGLYAGAVVYCDFNGNLDSAIAIRSMSARRGPRGLTAHIQAGAGIVADSQAGREYEEVLNKSRALREAVRLAEEGA